MRYLVLSDSHGRLEPVWRWLAACKDQFDAVIHAGDFFLDGQTVADALQVPYYGAQGNNDRDPKAPWETVWEDQGVRLGVIHGHQWAAPQRLAGLGQWAKAHRLKVVVYGHTHVDAVTQWEGGWLLNPGAVWRPRARRPAQVMSLTVTAQGVDWHRHLLGDGASFD
ncbi:MAG: YfcE family phosphodiesterase [Firmicutes bacterium]|nr:YfcE family phosphodiesterase [Alicyclobacillaceae bacterium]MCL6497998.1 YfcE family phosphodiesterase [Bacillota bacterium]